MVWYYQLKKTSLAQKERKEGEGGAEGIPETIVTEEETRLDSSSSQIYVDGLPWFINLIKSLWEEEESVETVVKEGSVSFSCLYNVKTMEEIFPIRLGTWFTVIKIFFR